MDLNNFMLIIKNLRYAERLTYSTFSQLFFPNIDDDAFKSGQWHSYATDPLRYLWSLSDSELTILYAYIMGEKRRD